ncbi:hypothetical protein GPECTOR_4g866 [Gonium pectorale]|uniref:Uncharacterized protein n=1 Tax=Gonium pectorale TaxID=33097 RepID=A0A150GYA6_GONPE|nr:hypothetical protein GPECTOR_4g866 [Gonium pectorale]|eukprot:KXZ54795.1 hypothetical protein GPECTOR_4g866 [Gonium pectorale]
MAYWGYKTPGNFTIWMIVAVLLVTGAIWLPIGGAGIGGCAYCADKLGPRLNTTGVDKGCVVGAYSFQLYEPVEAAKLDAKDEFYWFCINGGPLAAAIAGTVVFGTGLLFLIYFCTCAKPPSDAAAYPQKV